ncbi:MAG: PP2C family protein-serine/threonine phosphatase [Phycisphaerales bacterium]|nr:MAG: serine/threonine-protein phosphatase [Phycisphaerales bacterium]
MGDVGPAGTRREGGRASARDERLRDIIDLLKTTSRYSDDPQESVLAYAQRVRKISEADRVVSISRRGLESPFYRVTRSSTWPIALDPWKERERLPLFEGGLLSELIYAGEPRLIDDVRVTALDPAAEYLEGMSSLVALPTWDDGEALNMVVQMSARPYAFDPSRLPEMLWISNLFGRVTKNLVLSREVKEAYAALDREFRVVGEIQMALLPQETPAMRTLDLATHYQTSTQAGGDYFDFFPLREGRWAMLVADVSGHGTPAAVLMAILHAIAHMMPRDAGNGGLEPHRAMEFINTAITTRYTSRLGSFVTVVYAVYDDRSRMLTLCNAGHPRPLLRRRDGRVEEIDGNEVGLPIGITSDASYASRSIRLEPGESLVVYSDGITEAFNDRREMYGVERLERVIRESGGEIGNASALLSAVIEDLGAFAGLSNRSDDRTIVVASARE